MKYTHIILVIFVFISVILLLVGNLVSRKISWESGRRVIAHELNTNGDKIVYALCTKPIVIKITTTRGKVLNEFHLQQDCVQGDNSYPPLYNKLLSGDLFVSKDNVFYLYLRFRTKSHLIVFNETAILDQIIDIIDSGSTWMGEQDKELIPDFSKVKSQEVRPVLELPLYITSVRTKTHRIIQYKHVYYAYDKVDVPFPPIQLQPEPVFPQIDLYQGEGTLLMAETPWRNEITYLQPQGNDFTITGRCRVPESFIRSAHCNKVLFTSQYIVDGVTFASQLISPHSKRYVASNNDIVVRDRERNLVVLKPKSW